MNLPLYTKHSCRVCQRAHDFAAQNARAGAVSYGGVGCGTPWYPDTAELAALNEQALPNRSDDAQSSAGPTTSAPPGAPAAVQCCDCCGIDCFDFRQFGGQRVCILCVTNRVDALVDAFDHASARAAHNQQFAIVPASLWDAMVDARNNLRLDPEPAKET